MEQAEKEFSELQEKIKRDLGEGAQKALLEGSLESFFKSMGKPAHGFEYDAMRSKLGLDVKAKGLSDAEKCLNILYNTARARALTVAQEIVKYDGEVTKLRPRSQEFLPPEDKQWGFKLGDKIMIQGSLQDFKSLQKATLGWTGRLRHLYGEVGYVKSVMSEYDNLVGVCFPRIATQTHLYSGVLKKVRENDRPQWASWKVGEFVQTLNDHQLITIVQGGLVPVGKVGRIVGFTSDQVLVTFDEQIVHEVKPAILVKSSTTSNESGNNICSGDFKVGQKRKITSNMKKLIDNQKDQMASGGWNEMMSKLRGKEVTVLNINGSGGLNVQAKASRPWRISSDSILHLDKNETQAEDLEFTVDDVIRVKIPSNIRSLLENSNIPLVFLEYLSLTGEVGAVGSDHEPYVRFCNWPRQTQFSSSLLRKPSEDEVQKYLDVKRKIDSLGAGDVVHLDVGPPNFVAEVLEAFERNEVTIMALTNQATLKGFIDNDTAVIEYEDGSLYKVKKKLLSVPERFYIESSEKNVNLEFGKQIVEAVEAAVRSAIREKMISRRVQFSPGNPPSIEVTIYCSVAYDEITTWLQRNREWRIEKLCEGQLIIRSDDFGKVKLSIFFGDKSGSTDSSSSVVVGRHEEKPLTQAEARPIYPRPRDEDLRRLPTSFFRLYDDALGQDVYFPYVVHGPPRDPVPTQNPLADGTAPPNVTNNTYNIVGSHVEKMTNISR